MSRNIVVVERNYQKRITAWIKGLNFRSVDEHYCYWIKSLTYYTPKLASYRNQLIDMPCKSIEWFLYDGNFVV